jgi:hypothetical protein
MRDKSVRPRSDKQFSGGTGDSLRSYGGYLTGFADVFAGALEVSREAILDAVDGADPIDTFMLVDGRRGSDNPGGSTNRIRSDEHDREGVNRIFIGLTKEQFQRLANVVGAEVEV